MTRRKSKKNGNMGLANSKQRRNSPKLSAYQRLHGSITLGVTASHSAVSSESHVTPEESAPSEAASSSGESILPPSKTASDSRSSSNAILVAELEAALERSESSEEAASPRRHTSSDGNSVDSSQSKYPPGSEIRTSHTLDSLCDPGNTLMPSVEEDNSSVEDVIMTEGAQVTIRCELGMMVGNPSHKSRPDSNEDVTHGSDESECSDSNCSKCLENSSPCGCSQCNETMDITPKTNQRSSNKGRSFLPGIQIPQASDDTSLQAKTPTWFPQNIKDIFQVDHHGGALSFKELNVITRYRAVLEMTRRRKWKKYIKAGEARFKLRRIVQKLRANPTNKKFYEFRKRQYRFWKEQALLKWKQLEKTQGGINVLDDTINANFAMERMIYRKKLD